MKVLFILKTGATIDWPIPPELQAGFEFTRFCGNIIISNFFQAPNMHIKYDDMSAMLFSIEGMPAPEVQGMTKQ